MTKTPRKQPPIELELSYTLSYRLQYAAWHGAVIFAAAILLGLSWHTDRADLATAYRWVAGVIAALALLWALHEWRIINHPALLATREGVLLRNGKLLEWDLFSKAILVRIDGKELMGFRFRSGVFRTLDEERKEALRDQTSWLMARLACGFEIEPLTTERSSVIESIETLSSIPVTRAAGEIRY